jgi:hypothetical protein
MEHINDIYRCSSCPNKRKGEFGNVARIATPITRYVEYQYNMDYCGMNECMINLNGTHQ